MKPLGYPLTWRTPCFITPDCGKMVYAHTNGAGDFVLFDDLTYPWNIHSCYKTRTYAEHRQQDYKLDYRNIPQGGDSIQRIAADDRNASYTIIGTIINIRLGAMSKFEGFQALDNQTKNEIKKRLAGRTSLLQLTDHARQIIALYNDKTHTLALRDIIACKIKTMHLINTSVFVVTQLQTFKN